jgi:signal recognition particle subunit SRP54
MLFEGLSEKLQHVVSKFKGKGRVTESDLKDMMKEVKLALLEADVNFKVVKDFINKVSTRALGADVLQSLTPGQQVVKVVHEELVELLGGVPGKIIFSPKTPSVYMMVGLQGSGKTTTSGKLANFLRKQGKNPLLVACDVYRPAAIKQLQVVGDQLNIPVYSMGDKINPVDISKASIAYAKEKQHDVVIIDTAGRLHINESLMEELADIKKAIVPTEIILVVDSMTGQDAVNVASSFNEKLGIDGLILTKLDGDTRGGAALSVRNVTGKPIKFVGMGEKLSDLEQFFPDRMASRILGMGDVLSLIEKAQDAFDEKQMMEMEKKMRTMSFTLEDFLDQMQQIKKMGPISQIINMIPGMNNKMISEADIDDKKINHIEAIIQSMTKNERNDPAILNGSRRKRIAIGSGTTIQQVNKLLKDFEMMKKMMKGMSDMGKPGKKGLGKFKFPF